MTKHPLTKPMSEMAWVERARGEGRTSRSRWEEVSADWDQKKSTLLAAGDIPDLIIGPNAITDSDLATFGTLFEDLGDDMDALPNVQAMFDEVDGAEAMATSLEGPVYSLPCTSGSGRRRSRASTSTSSGSTPSVSRRRPPGTSCTTCSSPSRSSDPNGNGTRPTRSPSTSRRWAPRASATSSRPRCSAARA